jgi:hypothetical protein
LAGRSKKVSKFGHPLLQLGEAVEQIGHAWPSLVGVVRKIRGEAG